MGFPAAPRGQRETGRDGVSDFFLIRHASHDLLDRTIAGRMAGVRLSEKGREEAEELADRISEAGITEIHASPRERAQETAAALGRRLNFAVKTNAALDEVDFGDWTGRSFGELQNDAAWKIWTHKRSEARVPNGEIFADVQKRVVAEIQRLAVLHETGRIVLASHGDVIRAALLHYLAMSLDEIERLIVGPASLSLIAVGRDWAQVRLMNDTGLFSTKPRTRGCLH